MIAGIEGKDESVTEGCEVRYGVKQQRNCGNENTLSWIHGQKIDGVVIGVENNGTKVNILALSSEGYIEWTKTLYSRCSTLLSLAFLCAKKSISVERCEVTSFLRTEKGNSNPDGQKGRISGGKLRVQNMPIPNATQGLVLTI